MVPAPSVSVSLSGSSLRAMRWWDVEPVQALEVELFPDPWSEEAFWSELAHVPATRHYVVTQDIGAQEQGHQQEQIAGYAGIVFNGHQADVQTLAVATSSQRRGLGALLLDALLEEARRRDVGEVLLEVRAENAAAQALYAGAGFERTAVRRGYYQPGGTDAFVLRLRLHGDPHRQRDRPVTA